MNQSIINNNALNEFIDRICHTQWVSDDFDVSSAEIDDQYIEFSLKRTLPYIENDTITCGFVIYRDRYNKNEKYIDINQMETKLIANRSKYMSTKVMIQTTGLAEIIISDLINFNEGYDHSTW